MSCLSFELVSAYIDGEVSADEQARCERHLFSCPECRGSYRSMLELHTSFHSAQDQAHEEVVPLRLDLELSMAARDFLGDAAPKPAQRGSLRERVSASSAPIRELGLFGRPEMGTRQLMIAALVALVAMAGMAFFAARGGGGTLSSTARYVARLSPLGHTAMRTHLESSRSQAVALDSLLPSQTLEKKLSAKLGFGVEFPHAPFGAPLWGEAVELDGELMAMARYRTTAGAPVSLFVTDRDTALDRFGLDEMLPANACTIAEAGDCYSDGLGNTLCVVTKGSTAHIWVTAMPIVKLEEAVHVPKRLMDRLWGQGRPNTDTPNMDTSNTDI